MELKNFALYWTGMHIMAQVLNVAFLNIHTVQEESTCVHKSVS